MVNPPPQPDSMGYSLAMRVMQSDLYPKLDAAERAECDEFIRRGLAPLAATRTAAAPDLMAAIDGHCWVCGYVGPESGAWPDDCPKCGHLLRAGPKPAPELVSASTAAPAARSEKQSSVHPAVNDRTVTTSAPLQSPCALDRSELPVRLSDEQVYALGEHWHDEESMASVAMEDPTQCEHRALEVNAFCAGYRAGIATPVVQQAGDKP